MPASEERRVLEGRLSAAKKKKKESNKVRSVPPGKENKFGVGKRATSKKARKVRSKPKVQWAKKEYHEHTDHLLTIIEEKDRYRQALGFSKETGVAVNSGGQTVMDICSEIAETLFLMSENSVYTKDDQDELGKCVHNRVIALRTTYRQHREVLGETGHGLLHDDREEEIEEGSALANVWDSIRIKFPWYKRMDKLMGSSPVVNRSALANSQTRLDLTSLEAEKATPARKGRKRQKRDTDDHENSSVEDGSSSNHSDSENESKISWDASSPPGSPVKRSRKRSYSELKTPKAEPSTPSLTAPGPKRGRKAITDKIFDIAAEDRSHRLDSLKIKEQEKTVRSREKGSIKREIELKRMEFQAAQSEQQRAHELRMMQMQMQMRVPPPAPFRAEVWPQENQHYFPPPGNPPLIDPYLR